MSFATLSEASNFSHEAVSTLPSSTSGNVQDASSNVSSLITTTIPNQTSVQIGGLNYDGRRMRNKSNVRKTVDYNASVANWLHNRAFQRDYRDRRSIQPDAIYNTLMLPPSMFVDKPINCLSTRPIRMAMNKVKCPIFTVKWTPEGRRLITGASSGEFTLWNGLTFSFETILQAHDLAVRSMVWGHNDQWMLTADHGGYVKYWQSNMNNVKMYQIHKEPVRGLSFSPSDQKFASCSDDSTVRIWDFLRYHEEKVFRGHGADVRCVDWHPEMSIVASGSRDTQQPVKLWDVKSGTCLSTVHAHKHAIMDLKWNRNGNWLLTASRDHLLKLFDIRNISEEVQVFRGHKKEATTIAWHPIHGNLFASGGSDGSIMYWLVGNDKGLGGVENAHDTMVWSLDWHPVGHIIASGSNDHTTKFWTRNRPGDLMRDRYNLNILPFGSDENDADADANHVGLENEADAVAAPTSSVCLIPGLDIPNEELFSFEEGLHANGSLSATASYHKRSLRKPLHHKTVPREFEKAWKEGRQPSLTIGQQSESGFVPPDRDMMAEAEEIPSDMQFRQNRFLHDVDVDGYRDENRFHSNEFHAPYHAMKNFQNDQCRPDHQTNDFFRRDPHPSPSNGNWNSRGGHGNFSSGSRHYLKPPTPSLKRGFDELESLENQPNKRPHMDFGEDFSSRNMSSNFGFRGRNRGSRMGNRGYSYR